MRAAAHIIRVADEINSEWRSPWDSFFGPLGFRMNGAPRRDQRVYVDGLPRTVRLLERYGVDRDLSYIDLNPHAAVHFEDGYPFVVSTRMDLKATSSTSDGALRAPMPGKIVAVHVQAGATVAKGAPLVTLEAMKMEHAMAAPFDGTVAELNVEPGQQVSEGVTLVRLEAAEAA